MHEPASLHRQPHPPARRRRPLRRQVCLQERTEGSEVLADYRTIEDEDVTAVLESPPARTTTRSAERLVRFLVDAQLPPALARRLEAWGHVAEHVVDLGMADAPDQS